jgi:DNA-binding response OmpR family regulator
MDILTQNPVQARLLCIDDDPAITEGLRIRLRSSGYEVITAHDGEEGMLRAVEDQPDAIITDMRMPKADGEYLVDCLMGSTETCDIPIIVLTGRREPALQRYMLTLGVRYYLQKPPRPESLLAAISACLHPKVHGRESIYR